MTKLSYATELLDDCLSCAYRADVNTLFHDPRNVEERANRLSKVAYQKGKEVHPNVGANERRFVRRTASPDRGHLTMEEARHGRRVSQAPSSSLPR